MFVNRSGPILFHRGPYIDASYQVSVHFPMQCQIRRFLKKSANQKQELPVAAMFINVSGRNNNLYRGPYIHASYKVSVHLAKGFQRRRLKCEKFRDGRRRTDDRPSEGNSSRCLW
jgi:hypothetical protein